MRLTHSIDTLELIRRTLLARTSDSACQSLESGLESGCYLQLCMVNDAVTKSRGLLTKSDSFGERERADSQAPNPHRTPNL